MTKALKSVFMSIELLKNHEKFYTFESLLLEEADLHTKDMKTVNNNKSNTK